MPKMDELLPDFLSESLEHLKRVNADLDRILPEVDRSALLESIYRGVHTVKGGSAMFGYARTLEVAHALESKLSRLKLAPARVSEEDVAFIRAEVRKIESLLTTKDEARVDGAAS